MKPDLICFTGDLFDYDLVKVPEHISILSTLEAPYGKLAVLGNHDYRAGVSDSKDILHKSGFQLLLNENYHIQKNGASLYLAGIDSVSNGRPNIEFTMQNIPQDAYVILLVHEPDIADQSGDFLIDLQLSGHSHGGQIRSS